MNIKSVIGNIFLNKHKGTLNFKYKGDSMIRLFKFQFIFFLLFIMVSCNGISGTTESNEGFELNDIYSYEYNSIESEHNELITKWMTESRLSKYPISSHTISNDQERFGYEYVFAKGYKEFEITFVYSFNSMDPRGSLHIVGIKGEADDEVLVKIKYDSRYVRGTISSDQTILFRNQEM